MDFWRNQKNNKKAGSDTAKEEKLDPYFEDLPVEAIEPELPADTVAAIPAEDPVLSLGETPIDPEEEADEKEKTSEPIKAVPLAEKEKKMVNEFRPNVAGALQMKVVRPKQLREATEIADSLINGQTIVLNLDELSDTDGRRMIDYIAGIIYAIQGKIERPADRTFLLTPCGVNVDTEERD